MADVMEAARATAARLSSAARPDNGGDGPSASLPPSPPGEDPAAGVGVSGAPPSAGVTDGELSDMGDAASVCQALPSDWYGLWQRCVHVLGDLAKGESGVLPECGAMMPCGHVCVRTVHVIGSSVECACVRCGATPNLADEEYKRWGPLRDALKMRADGTVESLALASAAAETSAAKAAAATAAPAAVSEGATAARKRPAGTNLSLVGYNAAPPRVRAQSLRDDVLFANVGRAPAKPPPPQHDVAGGKRRAPTSSRSAEAGASKAPPRDNSPDSPVFNVVSPDERDNEGSAEGRAGGSGGGGAGSSAREAAAVAAGWSRSYSKSHQRDFWFHKATHRRAWTLDKIENLDKESGGASGGSSRDKSGSTSSRRHGDEGPVWKASYSSKRQRTFYVNRLTNERSWRKPEDFDG